MILVKICSLIISVFVIFSDMLSPWNISSLVSPTPMSIATIKSGFSSPLFGTSGSGAISFYQTKHNPTYSPRSASGFSSLSSRTSATTEAISFHQPNQQIFIPYTACDSSSSSSSSLCTCGDTGIKPLHQTKKPTLLHEALGVIQTPQNVSLKMSFSPICHPIIASRSSSLSLCTGGSGVIPYNQSNKQQTYSQEPLGIILRLQNIAPTLQNSYALRDTSFENDVLENNNRKNTISKVEETQLDLMIMMKLN
ncbi:PREDICTED: uncharacterized protein LOC109348614 [Lupinus angustifolius]|uniref:uncharacterized protein LOC109348614 n=1 Tax=Lupinus angustifolius TaxID=3871 RepID=UPI00092FD423|nr:PREDICTED: uncharacterized protein LOC109348614 [Lupinus angustifolius]